MEVGTAETREPWAVLLGVSPMEEYLSFLIQACAGEDHDLPAAAQRWRAAADVMSELAQRDAGAADGHEPALLPAPLAERGAAFLASEAVATSYLTCPPDLGVVPLDVLVVFQRQVNLRYVAELRGQIGEWPPDSDEMFEFCLAIDQPEPPVNAIQASASTFVFSSRSNDARFLGARLIDPASVGAEAPPGRPVSAVLLYVGYGMNAINVVRTGGRLVINNGAHRAYALRAAGVTHVIATIQTVSRPEDMALVPALQQNPDAYVASQRPPMLKDFFVPELAEVVLAPRKVRQIRLQFGMEQLDAPG